MSDHHENTSRRAFLGRAAYVAPAILTLKVNLAWASLGSGRPRENPPDDVVIRPQLPHTDPPTPGDPGDPVDPGDPIDPGDSGDPTHPGDPPGGPKGPGKPKPPKPPKGPKDKPPGHQKINWSKREDPQTRSSRRER